MQIYRFRHALTLEVMTSIPRLRIRAVRTLPNPSTDPEFYIRSDNILARIFNLLIRIIVIRFIHIFPYNIDENNPRGNHRRHPNL